MKSPQSPFRETVNPSSRLAVVIRFILFLIIAAVILKIIEFALGLVTPVFHDHVYLPLKGNLYHRYFPFSLACLVFAGLITLYLIFAFVTGRSLIKNAYVAVARRLVHVPGAGKIMLAFAWGPRILGVKPRLLEEIIHGECTLLAERFGSKPAKTQSTARRFAVVAGLLPGITRLVRASVERRLECAILVFRAMLAIEAREETEGNPALKKLGAVGLQLVDATAAQMEPSRVRDVEAGEELRLDDMLAQARKIFIQMADGQALTPDEDLLRNHRHMLAQLESAAGSLEQWLFAGGQEALETASHALKDLTCEEIEFIQYKGVLARALTLHVALACQRPGMNRQFSGAMEALGCCAAIMGQDEGSVNTEKINQFTAALHTPWLQEMTLEIDAREYGESRQDWENSVFAGSDPVGEEEFDCAAVLIETTAIQAGPGREGAGEPARWTGFHSLRDWLEDKLQQGIKRTLLIHRLDGIGLVLVGLIVLLAGLFCFGGIQVLDRLGAFDDSAVQRVADERQLGNFWDESSRGEILSGVYHHQDEKIYLAEENGRFHIYNPRNKLWEREYSFSAGGSITPRFTQLRSGSGATRNAFGAWDREPDLLWALNEHGGLASRRDGRWSVVIGDRHSFLNEHGTNITAAAVSENGVDRRWLVLGSRTRGVGVYDVAARTWREDIRKRIAGKIGQPVGIVRVLWFQERFWVATADHRLFTIAITGKGTQSKDVTIRPYPIPGRRMLGIKDLDVDSGQGCLWLLAEREAANADAGNQTGGTWLAKIRGPNSRPEVLLDERNIYPDLSNAVVQFAMQRGGTLVLAGEKGVYSYALETHSWSRLLDKPAYSFLKEKDGSGFYFAFGDRSNAGIGRFRFGGRPQVRQEFIGKAIRQLLWHPHGGVMALTDEVGISNGLYLVEDAGQQFDVRQVYSGSYSGLNPQAFTSAVMLNGNSVLFLGPNGMMIHDMEKRRYRDHADPSRLPNFLLSEKLKAIRNGNWIILATPNPAGADVQLMKVDAALQGQFRLAFPEPVSLLSADYLSTDKWNDQEQGFSVRTTEDNVLTFPTEDDQSPMVVGAPGKMIPAQIIDAAQAGESLWMTDGSTLFEYQSSKRAWSPARQVGDGKALEGLVAAQGTLLGRTKDGQVVNAITGIPVLSPGAFTYGDAEADRVLRDEELGDVFPANKTLYLAGRERIWTYDVATRTVGDQAWDLKGSRNLRILGALNGKPVVWSMGTQEAFWGESQLPPENDPVLNISLGSNALITMRQSDASGKYLRVDAPDAAGGSRVYFKHPRPVGDAAGARQMLDARPLGNGTIGVLTDQGMTLYYPQARSWLGMEGVDEDFKPSRIYQLAGQKLVLEEQSKFAKDIKVRLVDLPLSSPNPLTLDPIRLDPDQPEATGGAPIIATAFQEARGEMVYITQRGKIVKYTTGIPSRETVLLNASNQLGPKAGERLWRIYEGGAGRDEYYFAARDSLWVYDVGSRQWADYDYDFPGFEAPLIDNINVEFDGNEPWIHVTSRTGVHYSGAVSDGEVGLEKVFTPQAGYFSGKAENLLDVQEDDTVLGSPAWRFVLRDRIKTFDPQNRAWRANDILLSEKFEDVQYRKLNPNQSPMVQIQGKAGKRLTWWVHRSSTKAGTVHPPSDDFSKYTLEPTDRLAQPLIDERAALWRLNAKYQVIRMPYREGQPYERESIRWPSPFYMDPNEIKSSFHWPDPRQPNLHTQWDSLVLFESNQGLRIFRPDTGEELELPPDAKSFKGFKEVRIRTFRPRPSSRVQSELWLINEKACLMLRRTTASTFSASTHEGIRQIVIDAGNRVWGRNATGWKLFVAGQFVDAVQRPDPSLSVKVFPRDGRPVTAVDGDGFIYYQKQGRAFLTRYPVPLRKDIRPSDVHNVIHDNENGDNWWVLTKDTLYHLLTVDLFVPIPAPDQLLPAGLVPEAPETTDPGLALPVKGLPILAIQKKVSLAEADFSAIKNAIASPFKKAEAVRFYWVRNGVPVCLQWDRTTNYQRTLVQGSPNYTGDYLVEDWAQRKNWVVRLTNGREAYDPVTALQAERFTGRLQLARPSGNLSVNTNDNIEKAENEEDYLKTERPVLQAPLDAGWLSWNRIKGAFRVRNMVNGNAVLQDLPPEKLVADGKLFFEEVHSLVSFEQDRHWTANGFGLMDYPNHDLRLDSRGIRVQLEPVAKPVIGAHGRFVAAGREHRFGEDSKLFTPLKPISMLDQGAVVFTEDFTGKTVSDKLIDTTGKTHRAFHADGGFLFDSNRRQVAFGQAGLFIQTDAGMHLVDRLDKFDPGIDGSLMVGGPGQLVDEPSRPEVFVKHGRVIEDDRWFVRVAGQWKPHNGNPAANRVCVDNPTWKWELLKNEMQVKLAQGNTHQFRHAINQRVGFSSDLLQDAVLHKGLLYVATDAFLEAGINFQQLQALSGPRHEPPTDLKMMRHIRDHAGGRLVYQAATDEAYHEWDPATRKFNRLAVNPFANVLLVNERNLRFRRTPGLLRKELFMGDMDGQKKWIEFGLDKQGRFPFDVIHSVATFRQDANLYLATGTGVQIYGDLNRSLDLNGPKTHLMTIAEKTGGGPVAAKWIGQPAEPRMRDRMAAEFFNPALEIIESPDGFKWGASQDKANATQSRVRAWSPAMAWRQDRAGAIHGIHCTESGAFDARKSAVPVVYRDGRFQHDRILGFTDFGRDSFTVWQTGNGHTVTHHAGNLRAGLMPNKIRNHFFQQANPPRLIRVETDHRLANNERIPRGIYLSDGEKTHQFTNGQFKEIASQSVAHWLTHRQTRPPVVAGERFRLSLDLTNHGRPQPFEYRNTREEKWKPVDWIHTSGSTVAMDTWDYCFFVKTDFWAASKAGLVQLDLDLIQDMNASVTFELNNPLLISHRNEGLAVTDFRWKNANPSEAIIRFDGDSEKVFQIDLLTGADTGVFTANPTDIFAAETFVDTPFWKWEIQNRTGLPPEGDVTGTVLKFGEPIEIESGRFKPDHIHSMAVNPFADNRLGIATEGGWYEYAESRLHMVQLLRPEEVPDEVPLNAIRHIGLMMENRKNPSRRIVIEDEEGLVFSISSKGEVDTENAASEFQCDDAFWKYQIWKPRDPSQSYIQIWSHRDGVSGSPRRTLANGRFGDDFCTGLPALETATDGKTYYHIPTKIGVFTYEMETTYPPVRLEGFDGSNQKPAAIAVIQGQTSKPSLAYIDAGRIEFQNANSPLSQLQIANNSHQTLSLFEGPNELNTIRQKSAVGYDWRFFDKQKAEPAEPYIDVRTTAEFKERQSSWRQLKPRIYYSFNQSQLTFWNVSKQDNRQVKQTSITLPGNLGALVDFAEFQLIHNHSIKTDVNKVYLIGSGGIFEVDVKQIISELTP